MADHNAQPAQPDEHGKTPLDYQTERLWNDSAQGTIVRPADPVAHSAEAMNILRSHGVEAYQAFLASQQ